MTLATLRGRIQTFGYFLLLALGLLTEASESESDEEQAEFLPNLQTDNSDDDDDSGDGENDGLQPPSDQTSDAGSSSDESVNVAALSNGKMIVCPMQCVAAFLDRILGVSDVRYPVSILWSECEKLQMAIGLTPQRVIRSTSCSVLGWRFQQGQSSFV